MPCRSRLALFAVLSAALSAPAMEAQAASAPGGIDTPQGTVTLPFSIQDNTEMTLGESGLGIGVGASTPMNLTVSGVVGIGTTAPQQALDVSGYVRTSSANSTGLMTYNSTTGATYNIYNGSNTANGFNGLGVYDGTAYRLVISAGNVGFGTISPSGRIDSETEGANEWAGMFNYNGGSPDGCCGVWAYGTSYGVYGQTTGGQAVQGYASSGWGGYFSGGYGVYGQSSGGHYSEFYDNSTGIYELFDYPSNGYWNGLYTNGSMVIGASGGAELCLNGQCVTSVNQVWAGDYIYGMNTFAGNSYRGCEQPNQLTGGCSCPSGTTSTSGLSGQAFRNQPWDETLEHVTCYYQ